MVRERRGRWSGRSTRGAIELWHHDPGSSNDLKLADGYFGTADKFEFNARHAKFPRGYGLPGRAWRAHMPVIMHDLLNSKEFLRATQALEIGINRGLGIPYAQGSGHTYVLTFLCALNTPIARRLEVWVPNQAGDALLFHGGDCDQNTALAAEYEHTSSLSRPEFVGFPTSAIWAPRRKTARTWRRLARTFSCSAAPHSPTGQTLRRRRPAPSGSARRLLAAMGRDAAQTEDGRYRLLVEAVTDYAIWVLILIVSHNLGLRVTRACRRQVKRKTFGVPYRPFRPRRAPAVHLSHRLAARARTYPRSAACLD
jgi:hypothetical protein